MHPRTLIRAKFLALIDSISVFKGRVYESRVYPVSAKKLPAVLVYTSSEAIDPQREDFDRELVRNIQVDVEIMGNGGDLEIDGLCEQVEAKVFADSWLLNNTLDRYIASTNINISGEGERAKVVAIMRFQVLLLCVENTTS